MSHSPFGIKHQKGSVVEAGSLGVVVVLLFFFIVLLLLLLLLLLLPFFFILGVPLRKGVIKGGKLMVAIGGKAKMRLDLNDIPTVLISLRGHGLAHAKDPIENSLDHGAMVPTGRPRWGGCSGHIIMMRSCTR
jgi:hypothetical protein